MQILEMNRDHNSSRARRALVYDVLIVALYLTGAIGGFLGFVAL
ncbi:MAG: hypothetical protein U1E65_21040 [Myxococcota bacterium]